MIHVVFLFFYDYVSVNLLLLTNFVAFIYDEDLFAKFLSMINLLFTFYEYLFVHLFSMMIYDSFVFSLV